MRRRGDGGRDAVEWVAIFAMVIFVGMVIGGYGIVRQAQVDHAIAVAEAKP